MRMLLVFLALACAISSCSSIAATRKTTRAKVDNRMATIDETRVVIPSVKSANFSEMRIKGAVPGSVTPASVLTITWVKLMPKPSERRLDGVGYVDLTTRGRIEVRLAEIVSPSRVIQCIVNGEHLLTSGWNDPDFFKDIHKRVEDKKAESWVSANDL